MNRVHAAVLCFAPLLFVASPQPAQADWKKDLEAKLEAQWTLAKLTFMDDNIRQAGEVLLLGQGGVVAERDYFATNGVRAGVLQPQSGANKLGALLAEAKDSEALQYRVRLPQYQPVFVSNVSVSTNEIVVRVVTSAQFVLEQVDRAAIARFAEGTSRKGDRLTKADASIRKAALVFQFERGTLEQQSFETVVAAISGMLLPPDHPDVPQPGTVSVGMSREQLLKNMGKPQDVIKLADREILVFDKIKVTLRDGKVVDVQ